MSPSSSLHSSYKSRPATSDEYRQEYLEASSTDLVLLEPLLEELLPALGEDGACELERLDLVELSLLEEDAEVLEDGREDAGLGRHRLELLDGLGRAQDAAGRVGRDLGRLAELPRLEEAVVLLDVEVVGAGKVGARGELDGEVGVVEGLCGTHNECSAVVTWHEERQGDTDGGCRG